MTILLALPGEAATGALGVRLAAAVSPLDSSCVIYLRGDLGAGKTTLVRALLQALGHTGPVKSPTYTLVEPYELDGRQWLHIDLYRLGDPEELEYLGLRDYLEGDSVLMVEWPERGCAWLPPADLDLRLEYAGQGRRLWADAGSVMGEKLLALLAPETDDKTPGP